MEAVVDSSRQSAVHNLMNRDIYYSSPKLSDREPRYVGGSTMATSTMVSPTTLYPSHPPPPYTHNPPPGAHPLSGLISPPQSHPPESRRTSDDKESGHVAHRQSLPSIHEALADPKPSGYAPAPPTAITATHPFTFSQPATPTTRPFGMEPTFQTSMERAAARRSSPPQPIHTYSRPEQNNPHSAPYDIHRHPSLPSLRTALPGQSPTGPRPEQPRHEQEQRPMSINGYSHPPPSNGQYSGYPTPSNPPSATAFSPQSPYSQQRSFPPRYGPDHPNDYPSKEHLQNGQSLHGDKTYGSVVKRNLDYWDAERSLSAIMDSSNSLAKVAGALLTETRRDSYHGSGPGRLPSIQDCDAMEHHQKMLADQLHIIRTMVNQNMSDQHQHSGGKLSAAYEQDDMGQWTEEGKMGYGGSDAKKRRGRAAPPGRCHSCNRAETPEWRRGPDGARTLCNACGLHYAKLTRKMGSKQAQNAGPGSRKSMDEGSTRS